MSDVAAVIDVERALAPVSAAAPAGHDVRYDPVYDELVAVRKRAEAAKGPANQASEWAKLADVALEVLATRSKHLQVAAWLLDALTRLEGFRGALTGFSVLNGLIDRYWSDLFPAIDAEDAEPLAYRAAPMLWVTDRLSEVLKTIPISDKPAYALIHLEASLKTGEERQALLEDGWPSGEQFRAAVQKSTPAFLQRTLLELEACAAALTSLEHICDVRFVEPRSDGGSQPMLSFASLRQVLDDAQLQVAAVVRAASSDERKTPTGTVERPIAAAEEEGVGDALQLVRDGHIDGLRLAQARVSAAPSGRERLLRQLQFAELCLEARVPTLALPLFREITRIIKERGLETWEREDVILRAWRGLKESCEPSHATSPEQVAIFEEAEQELRRLLPQPPAES
jgi:type VI secretion system protein ImpA